MVPLRLLQTNSCPNLASLNSIYPDIYPNCSSDFSFWWFLRCILISFSPEKSLKIHSSFAKKDKEKANRFPNYFPITIQQQQGHLNKQGSHADLEAYCSRQMSPGQRNVQLVLERGLPVIEICGRQQERTLFSTWQQSRITSLLSFFSVTFYFLHKEIALQLSEAPISHHYYSAEIVVVRLTFVTPPIQIITGDRCFRSPISTCWSRFLSA